MAWGWQRAQVSGRHAVSRVAGIKHAIRSPVNICEGCKCTWHLPKKPPRPCPLLFNVYNSNVDLQYPASGKPLKPLFTSGKVKIAKLDSGTPEKKENWFSIFVIEISSHIINKNHLPNCVRGLSVELYKISRCSGPIPPKKFLDVGVGVGVGWAQFFLLKASGEIQDEYIEQLSSFRKTMDWVQEIITGWFQTADNEMLNFKVLNRRHYTNWSNY